MPFAVLRKKSIFLQKNIMNIRKATYNDLPRLMEVFSAAKQIMRNSGNLHQWNDSYPSEDIVLKDIEDGVCHVICDENSEIIATMALIPGPDPTYGTIYTDSAMIIKGSWPDDGPYHVIHRIAASEPGKGVFGAFLDYTSGTIRIDTHEDNVIMHHLLHKNGFARCGYIKLASGETRVAYIRVIR